MSDLHENQSDPEALRQRIGMFPKSPGVYLMKDALGVVLYIGKAKDLRSRVSSYFQQSADLLKTRGPEIAHMINQVVDIDFLECDTEVDALLTENRLIKDIQPRYNERLRDDKSFPYLEITVGDDYPGVFVTRQPRQKGVKLYGPFTSAAGLRDAVNALQRVFKFRTCELDIREDDPKRRFFRPCLLHAINQCTAPCADRIPRDEYRKDIDRFKRFLGSKRSVVLKQFEDEMKSAAAEHRFEEAALIRDRIKAIQTLSLSGDVDEDVQPEVFHVDPRKGLARLGKLLDLENTPRIIEGIDIANLHGQESVGSLVCFIDGVPFKNGYRRFRIKTVQGIDDYAMIREVVTRRYRRAAEGEELFPDIILIDGGLGQLHAAENAVSDMFIRPPMIISLAKKEELVFVQGRKQPVKLARNDAALRLLQSVRDEAHRFAQHYHHILRRRRLFDEAVRDGKVPPPRNRPAKGKSQPATQELRAAEPPIEPIDVHPPDDVQQHPSIDGVASDGLADDFNDVDMD